MRTINLISYISPTLLLLTILLFINPFFLEFPTFVWNGVLIIFFTFSFFNFKKISTNKFHFYYCLTIFSILFSSFFVSPYFSIALFKVFFLFILSYVLNINLSKYPNWDNFIFKTTEIIVLIGSVLYFTTIGYYKNGLFMGLFNHSQTIGLFLVPLLLYYSISKFEAKNTGYKTILIIALGIIQIFGSYSRTSIFTLVFLLIFYFILKYFSIRELKYLFLRPKRLILLVVISGFILVNLTSIIDSSMQYITKSYVNDLSQSGNIDILSSRQVLYENSLNNFLSSPLFGNGFGIQFETKQYINKNSLKFLEGTTIPYSMISEKGNVYLMILEEGGGFVFFFFCLFLIKFIFVVKRHTPSLLSSLAILIMFNGESTFFSINGVGAFQFVFFCFMYHRAMSVSKLNYKVSKFANLK